MAHALIGCRQAKLTNRQDQYSLEWRRLFGVTGLILLGTEAALLQQRPGGMMTASNSTGKISDSRSWISENAKFFLMRIKGMSNKRSQMDGIIDEIASYARIFRENTGRELRTGRVLEIGYGARPLRLIALQSLGYDAIGIDLDRPVLGSPEEFLKIYRDNGGRRFIKTLIRHLLFDGHERRALDSSLRLHGSKLSVDPSRFLVGDVATLPLADRSVDFIFSEDVFEHIQRSEIEQVLVRLANVLKPNGLALITPAVFTGICGGHLVDWYAHTLPTNRSRTTEPWEHLRKRRAFADCNLNELRLADYGALFSKYFCVKAILNRDEGIGSDFLTPEIRDELSMYSLEELLCNRVSYVLTPQNNGSNQR